MHSALTQWEGKLLSCLSTSIPLTYQRMRFPERRTRIRQLP
jgi:hypothetical protein